MTSDSLTSDREQARWAVGWDWRNPKPAHLELSVDHRHTATPKAIRDLILALPLPERFADDTAQAYVTREGKGTYATSVFLKDYEIKDRPVEEVLTPEQWDKDLERLHIQPGDVVYVACFYWEHSMRRVHWVLRVDIEEGDREATSRQ